MVELAACAGWPWLLASLAKDGGVRLWDARAERCLAAHAAGASALVTVPDISMGDGHGRPGIPANAMAKHARRPFRELVRLKCL